MAFVVYFVVLKLLFLFIQSKRLIAVGKMVIVLYIFRMIL